MSGEPFAPCAWCGLGHRYGTTDPDHRHDPMACINTLRFENDGLLKALDDRHRRWLLFDAFMDGAAQGAGRCAGVLAVGFLAVVFLKAVIL